ncbi:hypothetical protein GFL88_31420 [Rhizobium leguminosarum bv. viciae]|nr:hypothetical protein [Rhizobium leguminosarum bv. viciae]
MTSPANATGTIMSSIITNNGAIAALGTLRSINGRLTHTSQQMSLGLRVATASDNAAYWSISTSMRSDVKAMNAVNDSVGLAQGVVDTAYAGMENVLESFVEIRNLVITASDMPQPGFKDVVKPTFSLDPEYAKSDVYKIDQRIQQLQDQAKAAMLSSSFSGVNLLYHGKTEADKASQQVFSFTVGYAGGTVQTLGSMPWTRCFSTTTSAAIRQRSRVSSIRKGRCLTEATSSTRRDRSRRPRSTGTTFQSPIRRPVIRRPTRSTRPMFSSRSKTTSSASARSARSYTATCSLASTRKFRN